jgi:predicted dehydrogenase
MSEQTDGGAAVTSATATTDSVTKQTPSDALRVAVIGVGGMGHYSVTAGMTEHIAAICDVDDNEIAKALKRIDDKEQPIPKVYHDYRKLLEECANEIDVVLIGTPDHHHAPAALRAIDLGKATFCQKPLAHNIYECYALAKAAREKNVLTQMGNQGHCGEPVRVACELIWAGAIGNVTATHTVLGRNFGGVGGRRVAKPIPDGVHWDEWIGPAPYRHYHEGLHPFGWRSYRQFGTGTIGDMACHNLDALFWALHVADAKQLTVECLGTTGGSDQLFPQNNIVRYEIPARGDMVPFTATVYDHSKIQPEIVTEAEREYGIDFNEGTLFVGDKGLLWTASTASNVKLLPLSRHEAYTMPEPTLPRAHGEPIEDLFWAMKNGGTPCSDFTSSAGPLTAFALLGHLAQFAGIDRKLDWDVEGMCCTNAPEVNRYVRRRYRPGWEV